MTKNIVIGVYRFLGFHICNHLLNQGNEVIGVEWDENTIEYRDEKAMLFSRNANFSLNTFQDKLHLGEECFICVSLYDYLDAESSLLLMKEVGKIVNRNSHPQSRILIFLPKEMNSELLKGINQWRKMLQINSTVQWIYVADLYGPWLANQSKMYFQQNMARAINIDDFCTGWEQLLELTQEEIYVVGEYQNDWREQLAQFFQKKVDDVPSQRDIEEPLATLTIQAHTSLYDGLQAMKEHEAKMKLFKEWNDI
ncbi:hypothetical protein [Bacillus sp. JJ722]|uniref:hypothetical protein n=1 Tax=Bacillus sp. JJ722 TaxID=3122973 RepID=UPI002FFED2A2